MSDSLIIQGKSIPVPANPWDNSVPYQLNSSEILNILETSWNHYKGRMIEHDGRPLCERDLQDIDGDGSRGERLTFSEGASYVLFRAVWINDEAAFYKSLAWAKNNLQRKNLKQVYSWNQQKWIDTPPEKKDHLFAWRYSLGLKGRKGGVIHHEKMTDKDKGVWHGGLEGASDADLDIAAALIFAWKRWGKEDYLQEARAILSDIWKNYVKEINGKYYLLAIDKTNKNDIDLGEINPGYFRMAYFNRLFPVVDPTHPWQKLVTSSYDVLIKNGDMPLRDENNRVIYGTKNLPSDWLTLTSWGGLTNNYHRQSQGAQLDGWDAFRSLYAAAQDRAWNFSPYAKKYLTDNTCTPMDAGPYCFLKRELNTRGRILAGYNHDGSRVTSDLYQARNLNKEQFAMYGAYLPYFYYGGDIKAAQKILNRLQRTYNRQGYWGNDPDDYYGQNWAWFGLALINNLPVPGLTALKPKEGLIRLVPELKPSSRILPAGTPDPLLGKFGAKLVRQKCDDNLPFEQLEAVLQELAKAPPNRVVDRDAFSSKYFSKLYPELAKIRRLDKSSQFKLFWYLKDFRSHWDNVILLFSVYAQKIIESTREDRDEKIISALEIARKLKMRISYQKMFGIASRKKLEPSAYSLAVFNLTLAEIYSQTKDRDEAFYEEGIALATSSLQAFSAAEFKKIYASKPDYFSMAKGVIVLGDLYQQLAHLSLDEKMRQKYFEYADYLYKKIASLTPEEKSSFPLIDSIKKAYSLIKQFLGFKKQELNIHILKLGAIKSSSIKDFDKIDSSELDLKMNVSYDRIDRALTFNMEHEHMTPAEMERSKMGTFYYLRGLAYIKRAGVFASQPKLKTPQEILDYLLKIKEGKKHLETMKAYLLETNRAEKGSREYAAKLERKTAFTSYLTRLAEGDLLTLLADRMVFYNLKELGRKEREEKQSVWQAAINFAWDELEAFEGEPYYALIGQLAGIAPEKVKSLADSILNLVKEKYGRDIPPNYKYLHLWGMMKQLEFAVRHAAYIPNHKKPLLVDYGKLAKLIKDCEALKQGLGEISKREVPASYFKVALNIHEGGLLTIEGKEGKTLRDRSSAERVLELTNEVEKSLSLSHFPESIDIHFRSFVALRKAEALVQAAKFKRDPEGIKTRRVARLAGIKNPENIPLARLRNMLVIKAKRLLKELERKVAPALPSYIWTKLRYWENSLKDPNKFKALTAYKDKDLLDLVKLAKSKPALAAALAGNKKDFSNVLRIVRILINENVNKNNYKEDEIKKIKRLLGEFMNAFAKIKFKNGNIEDLGIARRKHKELINALETLYASKRFPENAEILALDIHSLKATLYQQLAVVYGILGKGRRGGPIGDIFYQYIQSLYLECKLSFSPFDAAGRPALVKFATKVSPDPKLQEVVDVWR